ncbi:hypothetical protein D3C87_2040810 [compost metagenome]
MESDRFSPKLAPETTRSGVKLLSGPTIFRPMAVASTGEPLPRYSGLVALSAPPATKVALTRCTQKVSALPASGSTTSRVRPSGTA